MQKQSTMLMLKLFYVTIIYYYVQNINTEQILKRENNISIEFNLNYSDRYW